jgi:hypothetical protein
MLADLIDAVVGVDTHRDTHLLTRVDLADDGVIHDADDGGVEGPRPLVADGALVGLVPGCSVW